MYKSTNRSQLTDIVVYSVCDHALVQFWIRYQLNDFKLLLSRLHSPHAKRNSVCPSVCHVPELSQNDS